MFAPENKTLGTIAKGVGKGIWDRTFGRLRGAGISTDSRIAHTRAKWSGRSSQKDWRVKLTIPQGSSILNRLILDNELMAPLAEGNDPINGIFWPITPSIIYQHTTNYNPMAQTHSNYPFQAYQNSMPNDINIIGDFPVQNQKDARYWVAAVNFLRAVSKMFFGGADDELKGNPPPILHLSGYGEHMFDKVPIILNNFNVELRSGIDYICTQQTTYKETNFPGDTSRISAVDDIPATWAPTLSMISVLVTPIYSRESVKRFSMRKFVDGSLSKETGIGWV